MLNSLARSSSMVINFYQSQINIHTYMLKDTIKAACLFWAFSSLVDLSRETFYAFWSRSRTTTYLCYSYIGDTHPYMHSIYYCSMRIKVTSLCCLTSKERHGLQKKMRENKRAKSSSVQKKEEREWEKESSHALSKRS